METPVPLPQSPHPPTESMEVYRELSPCTAEYRVTCSLSYKACFLACWWFEHQSIPILHVGTVSDDLPNRAGHEERHFTSNDTTPPAVHLQATALQPNQFDNSRPPLTAVASYPSVLYGILMVGSVLCEANKRRLMRLMWDGKKQPIPKRHRHRRTTNVNRRLPQIDSIPKRFFFFSQSSTDRLISVQWKHLYGIRLVRYIVIRFNNITLVFVKYSCFPSELSVHPLPAMNLGSMC